MEGDLKSQYRSRQMRLISLLKTFHDFYCSKEGSSGAGTRRENDTICW